MAKVIELENIDAIATHVKLACVFTREPKISSHRLWKHGELWEHQKIKVSNISMTDLWHRDCEGNTLEEKVYKGCAPIYTSVP